MASGRGSEGRINGIEQRGAGQKELQVWVQGPMQGWATKSKVVCKSVVLITVDATSKH